MIANAQYNSSFTPIQNERSYRSGNHLTSYIPVYPEESSETIIRGTTYNAVILYESSTGHENTFEFPVIVNNVAVK